ncbi:MAG: hypothetical protein JKY31_02570 [Rhodobacteraceae bacterium]|nr:hypothetical protein [Paracoccaceae bacterium]
MSEKIFVLGDSRTGTTTLHKFLKLTGISSIHYFFKQSGVSDPAHLDFDKNWQKLRAFIDKPTYNAFSDYPLRTFYKEIFAAYPNATYILSTRKDVETWRRSMISFFGKFGIDINIDELTKAYRTINQNIRDLADKHKVRFIEICIDDDSEKNGHILSDFLGLPERFSLGWENSAQAYDNTIWSSRVTFYNTKSADFLSYVKGITGQSKAMLSEYGWAYLINDSSEFLDYCYGNKRWSSKNLDAAKGTLQQRKDILAKNGISYLKFAIPEKQIIYPQYLPKIFEGHTISDQRPAAQLQALNLDFFSYPDALLKDVRSYGHVYFRGDSHANWLGAYFIYHHIVETLNATLANSGLAQVGAFNLSDLNVSLAAYAGDLFTQLDKEMRGTYNGAWRALNLGDKMEHLILYKLPESKRKARAKPVGKVYLDKLGERETFRFSHPDKRLPKAVIFRDSTSDYLVDLLAQHFSESLFIWHKGVVYDDVIEKEQPDVVLHIMAERFIVQYTHVSAFQTLGV